MDYPNRAIRAVSREDLAGEPFALFPTGDAPLRVVANARALHVVPRAGD